jgi:predicted ATPase
LLRRALHDEPQHRASQSDLHIATSLEVERSAPEPNSPGVTKLRDLGLYHLHTSSGNLTPERLFAVLVSDVAQCDLPPLRAELARGAMLPLPLNRFFGRENEIAQLRTHLQRERLVTLSGAGGSGKTRLSLQVAALLSEERSAPWHGAVFFVPLADLLDVNFVADHILNALRVLRLSHLSPLENVVQALCHPPHRATLLVLDNFEHLVDDGAAIVHTLLERVPGLKCLVTSRRLLGVPGEREMPLAPLPLLPDFSAPERPEDLQNEPCVHLFLDRARSASPDFALTPRNAPAIAALCRRLECVPLALELAAARAGSLSPARMLALLETHLDDGQPSSFKRFDFLQSRERTSPARHRTLRATLDWSYNLLEPQTATLPGCAGRFSRWLHC